MSAKRYPVISWKLAEIYKVVFQDKVDPVTVTIQATPPKWTVHVNQHKIVIPEEYRKYVKSKSESRKKIALWVEQKGLCHWCLCLTALPGEDGYEGTSGRLLKRAATLDHVYSRLNPLRKFKSEYVMACHGCNMDRAKKECQGEFKDEHIRRSRKNDPKFSVACVEEKANSSGDGGA